MNQVMTKKPVSLMPVFFGDLTMSLQLMRIRA